MKTASTKRGMPACSGIFFNSTIPAAMEQVECPEGKDQSVAFLPISISPSTTS